MPADRQQWEERYAAPHDMAAPSEFLVTHVDRIRGRVLDVAGGTGRNALFLARRGNRVDLIDVAFAAVRSAAAAARAQGLPLCVIQADLESYPLPRARYDAVLNIRYLQRSLFEPLQQALKPGGILLFETFLIDQQAFGHPRNPDHMLQRGELRAAFGACEILVYEEGLFQSGDAPAYLARMLARRPNRVD